MSQAISRRDFFATLAAAVLPAMVRSASPGPKRLVAGTRVLEVNGRPARVLEPASQGTRVSRMKKLHLNAGNSGVQLLRSTYSGTLQYTRTKITLLFNVLLARHAQKLT